MSGLSTYGIYTVFFHYPSAHWAALCICVFTHCSAGRCTWVNVLYVFLHTMSECMQSISIFNHSHFHLQERAAVKSCIEHQIQQLMFSAGYSISHQGSVLGVYFMAFPVQSSEIGNEKAAKDSLIIRKAKGYY